jgi:hypothetical protein
VGAYGTTTANPRASRGAKTRIPAAERAARVQAATAAKAAPTEVIQAAYLEGAAGMDVEDVDVRHLTGVRATHAFPLKHEAQKGSAASAAGTPDVVAGTPGVAAGVAGTPGSAGSPTSADPSSPYANNPYDPSEEDALEAADVFEHIPGLEEARQVAKLSDSNIVSVYDCVLVGSTAYLIMEYVEGKTLARILDEVGDGLSLDVVAAVFSAVSHALEVAHAAHTLHLDIKPENVIINSKGVAKVADFGLAALMDSAGNGHTGGGTIGYMPLEQMRQEALDVRTDEWALASLTYEMLTGDNPFYARDVRSAQKVIEEAELVLPSLCWDELDAEADDIMFEALDPVKEERFPTVTEFADALLPHLGSVKKGKRVLAAMVQATPEALAQGPVEGVSAHPNLEPEPEGALFDETPFLDKLGLRGAVVIGRVVCVLAVVLLAAVGAANVHLQPGSAGGLFADAPLVAAGIMLVCGVVAALRPTIGALLGYGCLVVGLAAAGGWALAVALAVAVGAWWFFVGQRGTAQVVAGLFTPFFGSVGAAPLGAIASGVFLPVFQSVLTAVFSFIVAVILASCGSGDIMNWNIFANLTFNGNMQTRCVAILSWPDAWVVGASWVIAAALYSLFCLRGTRRFDSVGSIVAAVVLVAGVCIAAHFTSLGGLWLPAPAALLGALVPGLLGVGAAFMGIPDRARWAEEEWYVEDEAVS